jgi:hypothetical protein
LDEWEERYQADKIPVRLMGKLEGDVIVNALAMVAKTNAKGLLHIHDLPCESQPHRSEPTIHQRGRMDALVNPQEPSKKKVCGIVIIYCYRPSTKKDALFNLPVFPKRGEVDCSFIKRSCRRVDQIVNQKSNKLCT